MGFSCVQLSGIGDFKADRVKEILDSNGLKAVCTHRPPQNYLENIEKEIEFHKTLGCDICGIGAMPGLNATRENIKSFAEKFIPVSERLKREGLVFAYHNHAFEFAKINGVYGFDILRETMKDSGMKYIVDVYWLAVAGIDPARFIKERKNDIACLHFKDLTVIDNAPAFAVVGEGNLDWGGIISACREAGITYALIEQDDCRDEDPFDCLERSFAFLKNKLK